MYEVYASTRQNELRAWGWDEAMQQQFLNMQWNAQRIAYTGQYPDADHQLILWEGQPAGRLYTFQNTQEVRLVDITLLPESCNRGIGRSLLQELQMKAQSLHLPLRLRVLKNNPARRLYERLQFTTTGEDELHVHMEWRAAEHAWRKTARGDTR